MALSNILREPRKEITESLVGIGIILFWITAIFGGWAFLGYVSYYAIGHWHFKENDREFLSVMAPLVGVLGVLIFGVMAHEIGESYLRRRYWLRKRLGLCQ